MEGAQDVAKVPELILFSSEYDATCKSAPIAHTIQVILNYSLCAVTHHSQ